MISLVNNTMKICRLEKELKKEQEETNKDIRIMIILQRKRVMYRLIATIIMLKQIVRKLNNNLETVQIKESRIIQIFTMPQLRKKIHNLQKKSS